MAWAPPRTCPGYPSPNCGNRIVDQGKRLCTDCQTRKDASRPNVDLRELYTRTRWRRTRARILDRDPLCADCQQHGTLEPAVDVHHRVKPTSEFDFFDESNLIGLCKPCHSTRTARGE